MPPQVTISNATLQWLPDHRAQLPRLVDALAPGGWLAFQVPGNFDEPSHRLLHELAPDHRFAPFTGGLERPGASDPVVSLADLAALGCGVDAWETTYCHVLTGTDLSSAGSPEPAPRPILQALPDELRATFVAEYKELLREAYPGRPFGTVVPCRRMFVVAHRAD